MYLHTAINVGRQVRQDTARRAHTPVATSDTEDEDEIGEAAQSEASERESLKDADANVSAADETVSRSKKKPSKLTGSKLRDALRALQNRIQYPVSAQEVTQLLEDNGHDSEAAYQAWRRKQPGNHNQQVRDAAAIRGLRSGRVFELLRRLNEGLATYNHRSINAVHLATLLGSVDWDIERAHREIVERNYDLSEFGNGIAHLRAGGRTHKSQDERTALLMTLINTSHINSVIELLTQNNWDVAFAYEAFIRRGLPKVKRATPKLTGRAYHDRELIRSFDDASDYNGDSSDEEDEDDFPDLFATSPPPAATSVGEKEYGGATNRQGWLLRGDRLPARQNCPDPTKMWADYVRHGERRLNCFRHREEIPRQEDGQLEPFNWNDRDHVQRLNAWHSQAVLRPTGDSIRTIAGSYHQEELDWIHAYYQQLWDAAEEGHLVRLNIGNLQQAFNSRWDGQIIPGVDGTRPGRSTGSLNSQLQRILKLCNDFNVPFRPAHSTSEQNNRRRVFEKARGINKTKRIGNVQAGTADAYPELIQGAVQEHDRQSSEEHNESSQRRRPKDSRHDLQSFDKGFGESSRRPKHSRRSLPSSDEGPSESSRGPVPKRPRLSEPQDPPVPESPESEGQKTEDDDVGSPVWQEQEMTQEFDLEESEPEA